MTGGIIPLCKARMADPPLLLSLGMIYEGGLLCMENLIFSLNVTVPVFLMMVLGMALHKIGLTMSLRLR